MTTELRFLYQAEAIAGPLGRPSKMPGYAYGLPAKNCPIGAILAKLPGTVCSDCYALKGRYTFPSVVKCQQRRLDSLRHPRWKEAMLFMIDFRNSTYFRWHDSGDIQGLWHLKLLCEIAEERPRVHFWVPTRERVVVRRYLSEYGPFPKNLAVRLSGTMIDGPAPKDFPLTSTVVTTSEHSCRAKDNNGKCGDCRMCWDTGVPTISYPRH